MFWKKHSLLFQIGPLCSLVDNKNPPSFCLRIHIERKRALADRIGGGRHTRGGGKQFWEERERCSHSFIRVPRFFSQNFNVVQPNPALKCTEGRETSCQAATLFLKGRAYTLPAWSVYRHTKSLTPPRATRHKCGKVHQAGNKWKKLSFSRFGDFFLKKCHAWLQSVKSPVVLRKVGW